MFTYSDPIKYSFYPMVSCLSIFYSNPALEERVVNLEPFMLWAFMPSIAASPTANNPSGSWEGASPYFPDDPRVPQNLM